MTPEAVVKLSKALADPTRFRLLQAIAATEEIACGALAARFPITQATCSQHLKVLADAGRRPSCAVRGSSTITIWSVRPWRRIAARSARPLRGDARRLSEGPGRADGSHAAKYIEN